MDGHEKTQSYKGNLLRSDPLVIAEEVDEGPSWVEEDKGPDIDMLGARQTGVQRRGCDQLCLDNGGRGPILKDKNVDQHGMRLYN